ncbi:MAG: acyltransferase family protein [Lachnospiraceae bacterium]
MPTENFSVEHNYNIDLFRFIAAILVIAAHAYVLNQVGQEWLLRMTNGSFGYGKLAVAYFFLISGYYISGSAAKSHNICQYLKKRLFRIFPPLIVVVLLTILILSFFSTLSVGNYFSHPSTWKYLSNCVLVLNHTLPGVFDNNVYGNTVNGSLWTLPVEFACYFLCYFLVKIRLFSKKGMSVTIILYVIACIVLVNIPLDIGLLSAALQPIYMFLTGMFMRKWNPVKSRKWYGALLSLVFMILGFVFGLYYIPVWLCLPYLFYYISFAKIQVPPVFMELGEMSYPIYLTAFPVQQALIQINDGQMAPFPNLILTIMITCILAACFVKIESAIANYKKMKNGSNGN